MNRVCFVVAVALASCASELTEPVAQQASELSGQPWLLELGGVPAGTVESLTPVGSQSVCGATTLEVRLGVNMTPDAVRWLNDVFGGKPSSRAASIYVATTQQKVALTTASISQAEFPSLVLGSTAPVFFKLLVNTPASQCTGVTSAVMADKNKLADGFGARVARAGAFKLQLGAWTLDPKTATTGTVNGRVTTVGNISVGDFTVSSNISQAGALLDWVAAIWKKKTIEFDDFSLTLNDEAGNPLVFFRAGGSATVTPGNPLSFQLGGLTLAQPATDGGT